MTLREGTAFLCPGAVVTKNERICGSHGRRWARGWERLGEHRGEEADAHDTPQPGQMFVV
jgi:hypothetical protein